MPPVEIPRLPRFEEQAPASVGRIEAQAPDIASATAPARAGIAQGIESGITAKKAYDTQVRKAEVTSWDIKTSDLSNQYETWYKTRLNDIGLKDGDTTKDYVDLDAEAQEKHKQLFSGFENMTPEFQQLLDKKVQGTIGKLGGLRDIQQSTQNYKYRDQVVNDTSKLNQNNFMNYGMYVDVAKPETFLALDKFKNDIVQGRLAQGEQHGTLARNSNGTVDPLAGDTGVKIRKDMGEALIPLVKSLNAKGKVAEGKKLITDYDDFLNAADKAKLISENDEADVRNKAIYALTELSIQKKGQPIELSDIDNYKGPNDVIRFKMKELNNINQAQEKLQNDRKAEKIVATEYDRLIKVQSGDQPYASKAQYANSPEYQNIKTNTLLNPSQQDHLLNMVEAPLKSTPKALAAYNDGVKNGNLYQLPATKYIEIRSGLDKDMQRMMDQTKNEQLSDSKKQAKPNELSATTGSELHSSMHKELETQMKNFKNADGDKLFETNSKGKFTEGYDNDLLSTYSNFIKRDIKELGKTPSYAERQQIIDRRLKEMVEQRQEDSKGIWHKLFGPADLKEPEYTPVLQGAKKSGTRPALSSLTNVPKGLTVDPANSASTDTTKAVTVSPSGKTSPLPDASDTQSWIQLYRTTNGKPPPSSAALKAWMSDKFPGVFTRR